MQENLGFEFHQIVMGAAVSPLRILLNQKMAGFAENMLFFLQFNLHS